MLPSDSIRLTRTRKNTMLISPFLVWRELGLVAKGTVEFWIIDINRSTLSPSPAHGVGQSPLQGLLRLSILTFSRPPLLLFLRRTRFKNTILYSCHVPSRFLHSYYVYSLIFPDARHFIKPTSLCGIVFKVNLSSPG